MATTTQQEVDTRGEAGSRPGLRRLARWAGWVLIVAGLVALSWIVYQHLVTGLQTSQAQDAMEQRWEADVGALDQTLPGRRGPAAEPSTTTRPPDPGDAYAVMWFDRPGSSEPVVHDGRLFVVQGTDTHQLRRGPGHYPNTAPPGEGNFAVAGHRTTYGAPFYNLQQLRPGDEVHVVDRQRREWTYVVRRMATLAPDAAWALGEDPLDTGRPTLTLTTCTPRHTATQRLVAFAELTGG